MSMQAHVVRAVFLVLCLSMLTLQNGCSNSGSGQAEAPGSDANAVQLALSTTAGELSESPVVSSTRRALAGGNSRADSSGRVTVTTDTNGIAQVLLTSSTTAGTAVVMADALSFRTHIDIFFVPGPAAGAHPFVL